MPSSMPLASNNPHFSKSKSRSLTLSSIGSTGVLPFNMFLHLDLALSVSAPFSAEKIKKKNFKKKQKHQLFVREVTCIISSCV